MANRAWYQEFTNCEAVVVILFAPWVGHKTTLQGGGAFMGTQGTQGTQGKLMCSKAYSLTKSWKSGFFAFGEIQFALFAPAPPPAWSNCHA